MIIYFDCIFTCLLQWHPEIYHHCPNTPFILVGTKVDLRDDPDTVADLRKIGKALITRDQGETLARELGAACYMECSSKTLIGLQEVFNEAVRISFKLKDDSQLYSRRRICNLL